MENGLQCSLEIETASWQIGENGHSKHNETQRDQNAQWENQAAYALNKDSWLKNMMWMGEGLVLGVINNCKKIMCQYSSCKSQHDMGMLQDI